MMYSEISAEYTLWLQNCRKDTALSPGCECHMLICYIPNAYNGKTLLTQNPRGNSRMPIFFPKGRTYRRPVPIFPFTCLSISKQSILNQLYPKFHQPTAMTHVKGSWTYFHNTEDNFIKFVEKFHFFLNYTKITDTSRNGLHVFLQARRAYSAKYLSERIII
jgi:hypothetical protein